MVHFVTDANINNPKDARNRQILRMATQSSHALAEQSWAQGPLADFPIQKFLSKMLELHLRLGRPAAEKLQLEDMRASEIARIAALFQDLGAHAEISGPPVHIDSPDTAWGVLYTLNGSALGATELLGAVPPVNGRPSAYLSVMRDFAASGALGDFFRRLDRCHLDHESAIAGAVMVFDAMAGTPASKGAPICPHH